MFDSPKKCKEDDPESPEEGAPEKFGFKTPEDKEETKERWGRWLHKKDKSTPTRVTQVHT